MSGGKINQLKQNKMKFTNKQHFIEQAIRDEALYDFLEFSFSCKDLQEIFETAGKTMRRWCLENGYEQFAEFCNWSEFGGLDWSLLLEDAPEYADRCDWSKLDAWGWSNLLEIQPQLAVYQK